MKQETKKKLIRILPYIFLALLFSHIGVAWRNAEGWNASEKILDFIRELPAAFSDPLPLLYPTDLCTGGLAALLLRTAVYMKSKNQKKLRQGVEYGSARWGTAKDIAPFIDLDFRNNVILTKTERLTMNSRPKNPKYARNKNVLIVGGSGSGKTRFWLKPNLLQMHSSYVVTDPKMTVF